MCWLISNLCYQAIEQVYLIKYLVSVCVYIYIYIYIYMNSLVPECDKRRFFSKIDFSPKSVLYLISIENSILNFTQNATSALLFCHVFSLFFSNRDKRRCQILLPPIKTVVGLVQFDNEKCYLLNYVLLMYTLTTTLQLPLQ